jgi:hypothetical protein
MCALVLTFAANATAQAWVPPKGEASLSLGYAYVSASTHLDYRGNPVSPGDMMWHNAVSELGYGITNRLAARVSLPFVISKYHGQFPHRILPGRENLDDGSWHETFQDFLIETRFRATTGSLAITPSAGLIVPSHDYEYYGHGAAGRKLVEAQFAVAAGRLLDPILPSAYAQVRYMFAVPEKVLGISHNRSQLSFDVGYLLGPAFTVRMLGQWQRTHGGWKQPIDFPAPTSPSFQVHDQLSRSDYLRLGGGMSYSLTGSIDVNVFGYGTTSARSDVNMRGFGLSFTYSASPSQLIKKSRRQAPTS